MGDEIENKLPQMCPDGKCGGTPGRMRTQLRLNGAAGRTKNQDAR